VRCWESSNEDRRSGVRYTCKTEKKIGKSFRKRKDSLLRERKEGGIKGSSIKIANLIVNLHNSHKKKKDFEERPYKNSSDLKPIKARSKVKSR